MLVDICRQHQPRTQAQITKNRHTTVFLYRSVAKMSKRAGVLGEDSTGLSSTLARSLSLATDLYKNTVMCLFLVICAWVGGCVTTLTRVDG